VSEKGRDERVSKTGEKKKTRKDIKERGGFHFRLLLGENPSAEKGKK